MLSTELRARVERILRRQILSLRAPSGGYTPTILLICETTDGAAFVKVGTSPFTVEGINREIELYQALQLPCMPGLLGFETNDAAPILILEDLSQNHWPPPWYPGQIERTVEEINRLHDTDVPVGVLGPFNEVHGKMRGWSRVADDPSRLLATGIVESSWLADALLVLVAAEAKCATSGAALIHNDLRSDNLCVAEDRVIVIDWNWACQGSARLDLAFFLNSLSSEGGPPQETYLPHAVEEAAFISGFFAYMSGQPDIPDAPHVRTVQRRQLRSALPWAARSLGLPPTPSLEG